MKVTLTYKNGETATFEGGDALELDLDTKHGRSIFQIAVYDDSGRLAMSAYHWHNDPNSRACKPTLDILSDASYYLVDGPDKETSKHPHGDENDRAAERIIRMALDAVDEGVDWKYEK